MEVKELVMYFPRTLLEGLSKSTKFLTSFVLRRLPNITQGAFFLRIKRPRREADHSPPSSAELKNEWSYTSTPHASSWRGA